jgi:hypothetical protein
MQTNLRDAERKLLPVSFQSFFKRLATRLTVTILCLLSGTTPVDASKDHAAPHPGFVTEFAASMEDVLQALQEVLHDQTIHGTQVFDRESTLTGAITVQSTPLFEPWKDEGKVFYKIRTDAIAPRHFHESADQGTIAVRYVVTSVSPEHARLRIDAIFVETAHRAVHPSDGTVESSEYRVIQDHLQAIQFAEQEAADAKQRRESMDLARQTFIRQREDEAALLAAAQSSVKDLELHVASLRHEVERRVKAPGASLKAAPFGSAANVANLTAYTEVVIVIITPHWYGVETPTGLRGWLPLSQLELLP